MGPSHGIGDLARGMAIRRQNLAIKTETFAAGQSMASGKRNTMEIVESGEGSKLAGLNRQLNLLDQYGRSMKQLGLKLDSVQMALEQIRDESSNTVLKVIAGIGQKEPELPTITLARSEQAVRNVVAVLNRSAAGGSLFSGAATDKAAIGDVDQLLSDVKGIVDTSVDSATAKAAIDYYFDDPAGGFRTGIYSGSSFDSGETEVAKNEAIKLDLRADSDEIKDVLKSLVTIYAAANSQAGPNNPEKISLLKLAAEEGLGANQQIVFLQQRFGAKQESLELALERNEFESGALSKAKNAVTSVDIYAMASKFQEMQVQLEAAFQVTTRLSSLTISNFLR